ncbi:hypothetical protein OIU84_003595, partial [Salix udensis]
MGAEVNRKFGLQWFKRRDLLGQKNCTVDA